MELDPNFITELRVMFLNGASPTHLIHHVAARYSGEPMWAFYTEEYFSQAFQIGMLVPPRIYAESVDRNLLRDMVGRCPLWRDSVAHLVPLGSAWCDGLTVAIDDLPMAEAIHPEAHPALADLWPTLPERAQLAIRQSMVNAQACYERMQVFVRLAGRLQERVAELERHIETAEVPS